MPTQRRRKTEPRPRKAAASVATTTSFASEHEEPGHEERAQSAQADRQRRVLNYPKLANSKPRERHHHVEGRETEDEVEEGVRVRDALDLVVVHSALLSVI
uniref:Uncharacterized protein n=1 Tax=Pristionchus pacificus TaxID=54126 RepID=A0A2A6C0N0_PRIPA|eukprot:PDM71573.1 hypothetical protein PRIPAC_37980 [Pristionchus pacificus]